MSNLKNDEDAFEGVKMCLNGLPDIPLRKIVSYLPFDDAVRFSQIHSDWSHLQPTVQTVVRDDFEGTGPRGGPNFCPVNWFDVEIETPGLCRVFMSWRWKDQGYGNQKGQIWLQLMREDAEIADTRFGPFELVLRV